MFHKLEGDESETQIILKKVNRERKEHKIWEYEVREHLVDVDIYAFSRGLFLVLISNSKDPVKTFSLDSHPFPAGLTVCNIFDSKDCLEIEEGEVLTVQIKDGKAKIYVISSSLKIQLLSVVGLV
jgi:hypothetical protein